MSSKNVFGVTFLCALLVTAFQNCGAPQSSTSSAKSSSASIPSPTPSPSGATAPFAPSGLSLVAASSNQINLTWVDNSSNETGFRVERAAGSSGPFAGGMGAFAVIATTTANINKYSDMSLQPSTLYYYRVSALNGTSASAPTAVLSATTPAAPTGPASPPSNLVVTATAATRASLNWNDNSNNESYFKVERSANAGATFTVVATTGADIHTWADFNLTPQSSYVYRVRATNAVGDSNPSANATVTLPAAGNTATYTYVSVNVLGPNCVDCHGPALKAAGYDFSTYNSVFANRTAMINSINAGRMPPGAPLPAFQLNALNSWLNAGAPNN